MTRILIADDQRDVLEALRILLKGEGYQTEAVTSLAGIFNALEKKEYALLLMDLNYSRDTTSGQEGLSAIPKIQGLDGTLPIVVMTAWATIELAVEAMKRGQATRLPLQHPNESFEDSPPPFLRRQNCLADIWCSRPCECCCSGAPLVW